jgi:hypothetical protein
MKYVLAVCATAAALLLIAPQIGTSQNSNPAYKLQVHVNYTGAGTVDDRHKIHIVLWDSTDFMKGEDVMPVAIQSTASKDGDVTFEHVSKTPAYVSAVYDPSGHWDAQSNPPEGSSLGLYSKTPGTPEPVDLKPGQTSKIQLSFDDSTKMNGGRPSR